MASSVTIVALSPTVVASSPTEVTSPSETSPRLFRAMSPHPPFRPSAVVLKYASTCPFISIEGSTISDLPPMGSSVLGVKYIRLSIGRTSVA